MWIKLIDIQEVELVDLVIICRGEKEKGIKKNVQSFDLGIWEKDSIVY